MQLAYNSTDISIYTIRALNTDGKPLTDKVAADFNINYLRNNVSTNIVLSDLAITDPHSDGGIIHWDEGWYRLDCVDAMFLDGTNYVYISGSVDGGTLISAPIKLIAPIQGSGSILVDHDYGGVDALRVLNPDNEPVGDVLIQARFTGGTVLQGESRTLSDGRWAFPMLLAPGNYILSFVEEGYYLKTRELTVA